MPQFPSIFNDVLGPVMRGPSSSHTAASVRIGDVMRQLAGGKPRLFIAEFDPQGSLAVNYHSQCVDIGLAAGLLGMDANDANLLTSLEIAKSQGLEILFKVVAFENSHPNTFRLSVEDQAGKAHFATALSTGGGMLEFIEIDGFSVSITGGFYETLIQTSTRPDLEEMKSLFGGVTLLRDGALFELCAKKDAFLLNIKTIQPLSAEIIAKIEQLVAIKEIIALTPVLPIRSQIKERIPFESAEAMLDYGKKQGLALWELAAQYESIRGGISTDEAFEQMRALIRIMQGSVREGLNGTEYGDRILGRQSHLIQNKKDELSGSGQFNQIIAYITAIMEVKSSMGVIIAAPTAGSCGTLPGTVLAVGEQLNCSEDQLIKGMFAAGMIGIFIAHNGSFAAELGGCQNECGAGSGMAAAALVELMGGSAQMAVDAASMALQNIIGMVCDPVAERVEVPCLGKNIMCGLNALASANMAIAGFDKVIPLDEVIEVMYEAGTLLPSELRCTGNAGLGITKTAQNIKGQLQ